MKTHGYAVLILIAVAVLLLHAGAVFADSGKEIVIGAFRMAPGTYTVDADAQDGGAAPAKWTLDLSPAFGSGAFIPVDAVETAPDGSATLTIVSKATLQFGPYSSLIEPGFVTYSPAEGGGELSATLRFLMNIGGMLAESTATVRITTDGIGGTSVLLMPAGGRKTLFSARTNAAKFAVRSGEIEVAEGRAGSAVFDAAVSVLGNVLSIDNLHMTVIFGTDLGLVANSSADPDITGHAKGKMTVGKMILGLPEGLDFACGTNVGFEISAAEATLDISGILPGMNPIGLTGIRMEKGVLAAVGPVGTDVVISKKSYSFSNVTVRSEIGADGEPRLVAVFDGVEAGKKNQAAVPGLVRIDSDGMVIIAADD